MKTSDVKRLWGRSGNRCAIGRIELSSDESGVVGDTCHIVAQSPDGPRGVSQLTREERDRYDNLVLLCPTHHRLIDSNTEKWSVDSLCATKREHEKWVSDRLDERAFSVESFNSIDFLKMRAIEWRKRTEPYPSLVLSLTPYRISDDVVVANDREALSLVNAAAIGFEDRRPDGYSDRVNSNHTKPSPGGMRNETFNRESERKHSVELCRSGHCECLLSFEQMLRGYEDRDAKYGSLTGNAKYVLHYPCMANAIASSLEWLSKAWERKLPFHEMTLTASLLNLLETNLFAQDYGMRQPLFGAKPDIDAVSVEWVVYREFDIDDIIFSILTRFSNSYGLWLHSLRDERGEWKRPDRQPQ